MFSFVISRKLRKAAKVAEPASFLDKVVANGWNSGISLDELFNDFLMHTEFQEYILSTKEVTHTVPCLYCTYVFFV